MLKLKFWRLEFNSTCKFFSIFLFLFAFQIFYAFQFLFFHNSKFFCLFFGYFLVYFSNNCLFVCSFFRYFCLLGEVGDYIYIYAMIISEFLL